MRVINYAEVLVTLSLFFGIVLFHSPSIILWFFSSKNSKFQRQIIGLHKKFDKIQYCSRGKLKKAIKEF